MIHGLSPVGRRFPIQRGPDVPWEVMAPHESQAQRNHDQSLERLAKRGGLDTAEAWAVVMGLDYSDMEKAIGWAAADRLWRQYAERVNLHCDELGELKAALADRDARLVLVTEALFRHGVHFAPCRYAGTTSRLGPQDECSCGLRAALADAGAGKERSDGL